MSKTQEELIKKMKENPKGIRFNELVALCDYYFGKSRQNNGSHRIYKMPWVGDPRVNIQNDKGKAKIYQVKQVLSAIERLKVEGII